MRLRCPHCNTPSVVRNSERQSPTVTYLYAVCRNDDCGHAWRVDAVAKVTLTPSARPSSKVLIPMSSSVRRSTAALHLDMAPIAHDTASGPLQLDLVEDAAPITQHPS
jgi:hypothetical protein